MTNATDQSWGYLDPATAKRLGIEVVCDYLSYDTSKNWTAAQVKAYHAQGIGVVLNWESQPGRPLSGAGAGQSDALEAVRLADKLIAAVGAPSSKIAIVFSCDRDVNSSQWAAIDGYYAATKAVVGGSGFLNGAYGEADLIDHLNSKNLIEVGWQTLAWSGGRISPNADLYQSSIDKTLGGASVDLDQIRNINGLGAWWPAGSTHNQEDTLSAAEVAEIKAYIDQKVDDLAAIVRAGDGATRSWEKPFLVSTGDDAATAAKVLSDPKNGVLARVGALNTSVSQVHALVAAMHAGTTSSTASADPAVTKQLTAIATQLAALTKHLGGTA